MEIERLYDELELIKADLEMGYIGMKSAKRVAEPILKRINEIRLSYFLMAGNDGSYKPVTFDSFMGIIE